VLKGGGGQSGLNSIRAVKQGSATFIAVIVVPILVMAALLLVYWVYSNRKKGMQYQTGNDQDSDGGFGIEEEHREPRAPPGAPVGTPDANAGKRRSPRGESWMSRLRRLFFGTELVLDPLEGKTGSPPKDEDGNITETNRFDISNWLYMHDDTNELVFVTPRKLDALRVRGGEGDLEMMGAVEGGRALGDGSESEGEENIDNVHIRVQKGKTPGSGDGSGRSVSFQKSQRRSARDLFDSPEPEEQEEDREAALVSAAPVASPTTSNQVLSASRNMSALLGNDIFDDGDEEEGAYY
jgi:hypothetical protein